MVETVIKHLTEFKQMTEAAIPFRLLNEQGEINCARAAEKIIKNQVADIIPSLREETLLYLMENPEAIDCLGKLKKEEDSLNMERFQKILSNVENDKLSDIGYGQMKKIYFCFLKYINTKEMLEEFIEKEIKNINGWYLEQKKKDDVIISASPEFLVKAFMGKLGITSVIASKVDIETGEFYGENCYGEEKVVRFQKMYGMTRVEKFYTDSVSDLPMAKRAEKAYLVRNGKVGDFLL